MRALHSGVIRLFAGLAARHVAYPRSLSLIFVSLNRI